MSDLDVWENILNGERLKVNVNFAAAFVLHYECLKDFVISQVRDFYCDIKVVDGEIVYQEDLAYKKEVRELDKKVDNASLHWFVNSGAITEDDYLLYQEIRQKRNEIVHRFYDNLCNGFTEDDAKLFAKLIELYKKLDKWWINEIEIPIAGDEIPDGYDSESVCGGVSITLDIINDIIFSENSEKYKDLLRKIRNVDNT